MQRSSVTVTETFEKDKDKKGVNAAEQAPGLRPGAAAAPSVTPSRVSMIELDDWILKVSLDDCEEMVGSIERVMGESGGAVSVCPLRYAPDTKGVRRWEPRPVLR